MDKIIEKYKLKRFKSIIQDKLRVVYFVDGKLIIFRDALENENIDLLKNLSLPEFNFSNDFHSNINNILPDEEHLLSVKFNSCNYCHGEYTVPIDQESISCKECFGDGYVSGRFDTEFNNYECNATCISCNGTGKTSPSVFYEFNEKLDAYKCNSCHYGYMEGFSFVKDEVFKQSIVFKDMLLYYYSLNCKLLLKLLPRMQSLTSSSLSNQIYLLQSESIYSSIFIL